MKRRDAGFSSPRGMCLIFACVFLVAGWLILTTRVGIFQTFQSAYLPTGTAQLVSIQPMPAMDGEMCQWMPASAQVNMVSTLLQGSSSQVASTASPEEAARRPPLRVIRDSYAAFSSVAVDPDRNEVVATDENLFQILAYDRLANTPPTAAMTEPKRVIAGRKTKIEFQCGVYIDPASGDVYAVNNDTVDTLVIFSREAKGNVPPDREIYTPHGTFGIAVDESKQELFLTAQHSSSVVVYHKMAKGDDDPLRMLQGNRTRLADPHGIALDTKNNLMFVSNHGSHAMLAAPTEPASRANWPSGETVRGSGKILGSSITVYPMDAQGDTPPLRVIGGPKTLLNWPSGLAVDPQRGELYVANDAGDSILVFRTNAGGDVAPLRVIKGPRSGIKNPTGLSLDTKNNELWVSNFGNHTLTVYKPTASGDTPPLRSIRSAPPDKPSMMIGNPGAGVAYDTKREEILVPN